MKNESGNKFVAQGVATWQEKETHERIMGELNAIYGYVDSYFYINGNYYYWSMKLLDCKRAVEIAQRGNHEEIMYMINQYGKCFCPEHKRCGLYRIDNPVLPDEVQVIVATRNDPEEMAAFLQYWGFGANGQDAVLARENHNELLNYVNKHGLQTSQQYKLRELGFDDVWDLHIKNHGLCTELLDEIFEKMTNGNTDDFYHFINLHELPVTHQIKMIQVANSSEFKAYVNRYGLWSDVHKKMVEYRSMDDITHYISKHRFLESSAEYIFAIRSSTEGRKLYLRVKAGSVIYFVQHLLSIRPLDYEVLTDFFLNVNMSERTEAQDVELMKSGSHEEVMERVNDISKPLSNQALAALFFRNNQEEFETCLNNQNYYLR